MLVGFGRNNLYYKLLSIYESVFLNLNVVPESVCLFLSRLSYVEHALILEINLIVSQGSFQ